MAYSQLVQKAVLAALAVVVGMVCGGAVPTHALFEAVIFFIAARGCWLVWQWRFRPPTEAQWTEIRAPHAGWLLK